VGEVWFVLETKQKERHMYEKQNRYPA
jgi:hypothetical protein